MRLFPASRIAKCVNSDEVALLSNSARYMTSSELASLQRLSGITESLLTDVLSFPLSIGVQPLRSEPGRFADLAEWHHYCEYLREQLHLHESRLAILQTAKPDSVAGEDDGWIASAGRLQASIAQLQKDVTTRNEKNFVEGRIVDEMLKFNKRLDVAKALDGHTTNKDSGTRDDGDKETQYAVLLAEQQVAKTKTLIKLQNDICQLEKRLLDLNIENVELKQSNRTMANSVRSARGDIEYDAQVAAMNREMSPDAVFRKTRLLIEQNTVVRNIFQRLILESGVNWAADNALRAFMLESVPQT